MKFVPSLPPPRISGVGDSMMMSEPTATRAVKPVQSRTLPPLVTPAHEHHEPRQAMTERRRDPHAQTERRTYCRRFGHLSVLIELRAGLERRRRNQREKDQTEHIDIEA